jgi:hypothetical protein
MAHGHFDMYYLLETTDWGDSTPNHIYIFENKKSSKCIGYIPAGGSEISLFVKPMPFDKRKRTFKEIKLNG